MSPFASGVCDCILHAQSGKELVCFAPAISSAPPTMPRTGKHAVNICWISEWMNEWISCFNPSFQGHLILHNWGEMSPSAGSGFWFWWPRGTAGTELGKRRQWMVVDFRAEWCWPVFSPLESFCGFSERWLCFGQRDMPSQAKLPPMNPN